jgi:hypothetical protein
VFKLKICSKIASNLIDKIQINDQDYEILEYLEKVFAFIFLIDLMYSIVFVTQLCIIVFIIIKDKREANREKVKFDHLYHIITTFKTNLLNLL